MPDEFLAGHTLDGEAVAIVLDLEGTRAAAVDALHAHASDLWGWGSAEYEDICAAVDIVLDAITFNGRG